MRIERKNIVNAIDDICEITTIPVASMHKLFDKISWCICNCVDEAKLAEEEYCEINIGIGTLIIGIEQNALQYKFIPSMKLEEALVATIVKGNNPLEIALEETFVNRILKTYKDML